MAIPADVVQLEVLFLGLRQRPAATQAALATALDWLAPTDTEHDRAACRAAGLSLAAADALVRGARELPYHNRHHVAETMLAAAWLGREACAGGTITQPQALLAVVAMAGHDLGHDGTRSLDGRLEAQAAAAMRSAVCEAGLGSGCGGTIERLIVATAHGGRLDGAVESLVALVREADVLSSLLPRLGWRLTAALRREWLRAGDPAAQTVTSFAEREAFLRSHAQPSPAATRLGVAAAVERQIRACEVAARMSGAAGAGLDALPRPQAMRRYRAALAAG